MSSFGERLKEERLRLGLSQEEFGEIGGVQKLAQRNYEKGNRNPDASYIAAVTAAGVDILYVLTGQRNDAAPALSSRETALLDNYRHSNDQGRDAIEKVALVAAQPQQGLINQEKGA